MNQRARKPHGYECSVRVLWDLVEGRLEVEEGSGEECVSAPAFANPFIVAEGLDPGYLWTLMAGVGYTISSVAPSPGRRGEGRLEPVCGVREATGECPFALATEEDVEALGPEGLAEAAGRVSGGLFVLSGLREGSFFGFFERNRTTPLTFLFSRRFFDLVPSDARVFVVTKGLMTHNDVLVSLENDVGVVLCVGRGLGEEAPLLLPLDVMLRRGGRVFLAQCASSAPLITGFSLALLARTLFTYYRRSITVPDEHFVGMVYSWWKERTGSRDPPDLLVFRRGVKARHLRTLEGLASLGVPDEVLVDPTFSPGRPPSARSPRPPGPS